MVSRAEATHPLADTWNKNAVHVENACPVSELLKDVRPRACAAVRPSASTMRVLVTVVSLFFLGIQAQWSYSGDDGVGESDWPSVYPACGGQRQSPINLQKEKVIFNSTLKQLDMVGYGAEEMEFPTINNGHSVQLSLPHTMHFTDSDGTTYIAEQLHMHWGGGSSEISGSEHTIDGIRHAMEIHVVHFNSKYASYDEAKNQPDGLAVLAVLVEVDEYAENTYYSPLIAALPNIEYPGETTTLYGINIENMLPEDIYNYLKYKGSLTTPPCTENVMWFVFQDTVKLSYTQVAKIENSIKNHHNKILQDAYRKTQPLGQRVVEANFQNFPKESSGRLRTPEVAAYVYKTNLYLKRINEKLDYLAHYAVPKKNKKRKHN